MMVTSAPSTRALHRGLQERATPEEVGARIVAYLDLLPQDASMFPRPRHSYRSSMSDKWDRPTDLAKPLAVLEELTGAPAPDPTDVEAVREYARVVAGTIGMSVGGTSFKNDRLNRVQRRGLGVTISRRRYDKLFRVVARLVDETSDYARQSRLAYLAQFAKIGLAADIPFSVFAASRSSAAFVAYYAANLGRRSLFTSGRQARAMDRAGEMLLRRCEANPRTSWYAVAHVFPRWDVLARCTPEERGMLLEKSLTIMTEIAGLLRGCVTETMNIDEMVVRRGDDSSTWNALAGSWNKARDVWMAAAWSLDPSVVDVFNPGKVMRLMAADVVAWHRSTNGLDPDTAVWKVLPRPWDVLLGDERCTREMVIAACETLGLDPDKSGWAKPRPRTEVSEVRLTPETVHGVIVDHPQIAGLLRRAGWFSGYERRLREVAPAVAAAGLDARADHWERGGQS